MSDKPIPPIPAGLLSDEQIARIHGGDCTVKDIVDLFDNMKETYEKTIDFASYVIERVSGP